MVTTHQRAKRGQRISRFTAYLPYVRLLQPFPNAKHIYILFLCVKGVAFFWVLPARCCICTNISITKLARRWFPLSLYLGVVHSRLYSFRFGVIIEFIAYMRIHLFHAFKVFKMFRTRVLLNSSHAHTRRGGHSRYKACQNAMINDFWLKGQCHCVYEFFLVVSYFIRRNVHCKSTYKTYV